MEFIVFHLLESLHLLICLQIRFVWFFKWHCELNHFAFRLLQYEIISWSVYFCGYSYSIEIDFNLFVWMMFVSRSFYLRTSNMISKNNNKRCLQVGVFVCTWTNCERQYSQWFTKLELVKWTQARIRDLCAADNLCMVVFYIALFRKTFNRLLRHWELVNKLLSFEYLMHVRKAT